METRVTISTYVIDFLDEVIALEQIMAELKLKADSYLKHCRTESVQDWEVHFGVICNNVRQVQISKNKLGTYSSDKYKQITIHIPVPKKKDISWGVEQEKFVNQIDHLDSLIKNFNLLNFDFNKFENRGAYIKDCVSRAIDYSFTNGIKIKGVDLKLPKT